MAMPLWVITLYKTHFKGFYAPFHAVTLRQQPSHPKVNS